MPAESDGAKAPLKVYVADVHQGPASALADSVHRLEELGVAGYLQGDHLFLRRDDDDPSSSEAAADPFTTIAAVAALSQTLEVGTLVANVGLGHPALVLRHFARLADLFGGERVLAGIGAGWNRQEFGAIGLEMPSITARTAHLSAAVRLARNWFDEGFADIQADTFSAHRLPMAPRPAVAPRLMLGGGSPALLRLAGRHADQVDLHTIASWKDVERAGGAGDLARFALTSTADVERSIGLLEEGEVDAGRPRGATSRSMWMGFIQFCEDGERAAREAEFCRSAGLQSRDLDDCPYVLIGDPLRMAELVVARRRALGLDAVVLGSGPELDRFMTEVIPAVDQLENQDRRASRRTEITQ